MVVGWRGMLCLDIGQGPLSFYHAGRRNEKDKTAMDLTSLLGVLSVFVLIAANGFFVAAEFALVKVRTTRIEQLVNEGKSVAKVAQYQIKHLDTSIAATQLGITL